MISGKISKQSFTLAKNVFVSDTKNYIYAKFVFSPDWDGLTKTVHFKNGENQADITLIDDMITADRGVDLSAGTWDVWLHGAAYNSDTGKLEQRITTTVQKLTVLPYATTSGEPFAGNNASAVEVEVGKAVVAAEQAKKSALESEASKNDSNASAELSKTYSENAKASADLAEKSNASSFENLKSTEKEKREAKAWAVGSDEFEETVNNNAKFYSEAAKQVAAKNGFCHLDISDDGHLILSRTENIVNDLNFALTETGHLEVIFNVED